MRIKRTPGLVDAAKRLYDIGWQLSAIGHVLGVRGTTVRCWIDPDYARDRSEAGRKVYRQRKPPSGLYAQSNTEAALTAARLMKQIPPDTRDLTARICGDPVPGRRAIDKYEVAIQ